MPRLLEYLETTEVKGEIAYKCLKCGYILGPVIENYKNLALTRTVSASKASPAFLASESGDFVLKEYYCPNCGVMFEVDIVQKGEPDIYSVELN